METADLDAVLLNLEQASPGEEILLHHFESKEEHSTIFLNSKSGRILGFVVVPRKFPPVPSVPSAVSTDESEPKDDE